MSLWTKTTKSIRSLLTSDKININSPSGEGLESGAMCHCMVPGASRWIQYQHLNPRLSHIPTRWLPLRTGGFTMPVSFNKLPANQTTVNRLNCETFKKSPQKRAKENKCGALYWIRTSDRLLRRQLLCPAELTTQDTDNGPPSGTRTPRNQLRKLALFPDELMAVCDGGPCWIWTSDLAIMSRSLSPLS